MVTVKLLLCRTSLGSLAVVSDPIKLEHTLTKWLTYLEKFWDDEGSHDLFPTRLVFEALVSS